jgi:hypothetical protein
LNLRCVQEIRRRFSLLLAVTIAFCLHPVAAVRAEENSTIPDDTVIVMQRGGCERRCAVYKVAIFADGTVLFEGKYYLRQPGVYETTVDLAKVRRLLQELAEIHYFHLADEYGYNGKGCKGMSVSPEQTVITSIISGGQGKSINHYRGCLGEVSQRLSALEDRISATAQTARWIK